MWCTGECWNCEDNTCKHYISKQEIYFNNRKIQNNWNSLREWLEKQKEDSKICKEWNNKKGFNDIDYKRDIKRFDFVLNKMNELESKNKNDK